MGIMFWMYSQSDCSLMDVISVSYLKSLIIIVITRILVSAILSMGFPKQV